MAGFGVGFGVLLSGVLLGGGSGRMPAPASVAAGAGVQTADTGRIRYTRADVGFMQGMIAHHGQALTMAAMVPTRSRTAPLRMLAERITVSQKDEIGLIRHWLLDRKETAPTPDGGHQHHDPGDPMMPGMLTPAELGALEQATGPPFERLFLQFMIRHHEGALTMVAQLFASPGAGQDSDIFRFATDVDADQRAEIRRMRALLAAVQTSP